MTAARTRPPRIAAVCSKGGVGKTTISLSLAGEYSTYEPVLLFDADPQDEGSAANILDRSADAFSDLSWTSGSPAALIDQLPGLTVPIIIDTPPAITSTTVQALLQAVDLVLIPGSLDETRVITQTARTIDAVAPGVVYAAVLTRSTVQSLTSAEGTAELEALARPVTEGGGGVPIAGFIRHTREISRGLKQGLLPHEIPRQRDAVATDIQGLFRVVAVLLGIDLGVRRA